MSIFNKISLTKPKRSTFNNSHESKWTGEFGVLIPTYWNYFEPSSEIRAKSEIMCRLAPMLAPVMHRINIYNYWFAVPIRILMEESDFHNFFTGGTDGEQEIAWPKLRFKSQTTVAGEFDPLVMRLSDYLDFPTRYGASQSDKVHDDFLIDVMPYRAYQTIWNEYFRDQNTTPELEIDKFVGVRDASNADWPLFQLRNKCWEKDYFTSALPWAQRGGDMNMPFSAVSELAMEGTAPTQVRSNTSAPFGSSYNKLSADVSEWVHDPVRSGELSKKGDMWYQIAGGESSDMQIDVTPHTTVNTRIIGTINQLREAFSIQRWRERMAIGGGRYVEQINSMFGVKGDDGRLQRPLYLGGSRVPMQISEVLQTSESTNTSVQGVPAGRGFTLDRQGYVHHYAKEHCIVMCLTVVAPKPAYFQGMPRKCNITDRYDFPWPILGHLGEQPVKNEELFFSPDVGDQEQNNETFGYQSRYAQFKYEPNKVHGEFRNTLKFWHLAREFKNLPHLNQEFQEISVKEDDLNRIFAVPGDSDLYSDVLEHIWAQQAFDIRVKRPLPYFGTPK